MTMVAITGLVRNMNHIVVGSDDTSLTGLYLGLTGTGCGRGSECAANWLAWRQPRLVQHVAKAIVTPVMGFLLDRSAPVAEFRREDISPFFWVNGKMPTSDEWKALAANGFQDYRLKVFGLVEHPVELSVTDLRALGQEDADHAAPLHPRLVGHRRVGRIAVAGIDQAGSADPNARRSSSVHSATALSSHGSRERPLLRQPVDGECHAPAHLVGL